MIIVAPLFNLWFGENLISKSIYTLFSPTCHQLTQRSFCFFENEIVPRSCLKEGSDLFDKSTIIENNGKKAYKFAVCSRCFGFYFSMLIFWFMLLYLNANLKNSLIWFILVVPMAIDGLGQLFGFSSSNNPIRFITGFLAGIVIAIYTYIFIKNKKI